MCSTKSLSRKRRRAALRPSRAPPGQASKAANNAGKARTAALVVLVPPLPWPARDDGGLHR